MARARKPAIEKERDFEVTLLVKVTGFGKPAHEVQLAAEVERILTTRLGEGITVERIPVGEIVLP